MFHVHSQNNNPVTSILRLDRKSDNQLDGQLADIPERIAGWLLLFRNRFE